MLVQSHSDDIASCDCSMFCMLHSLRLCPQCHAFHLVLFPHRISAQVSTSSLWGDWSLGMRLTRSVFLVGFEAMHMYIVTSDSISQHT